MQHDQLLAQRERALERLELAVDRVHRLELARRQLGPALAEPVRLEDEAAEVVQRELAAAAQEAEPAAQHGALEEAGRAGGGRRGGIADDREPHDPGLCGRVVVGRRRHGVGCGRFGLDRAVRGAGRRVIRGLSGARLHRTDLRHPRRC